MIIFYILNVFKSDVGSHTRFHPGKGANVWLIRWIFKNFFTLNENQKTISIMNMVFFEMVAVLQQ